jgi:hypothetical protein
VAPDPETVPAVNPTLAHILAELSGREPIFHRPEHGTTREDFERMTAVDFEETGASGRRYSRDDVLRELDRRRPNPALDIWQTSDFRLRELAPDLFLLTYTLLQNKERLTRRSTIWHRSAEGWKIYFHQGTLVQDQDNPQP